MQIHVGYELKAKQKADKTSFVREHVFAVLPTGFGKSLCSDFSLLVFDCIRED